MRRWTPVAVMCSASMVHSLLSISCSAAGAVWPGRLAWVAATLFLVCAVMEAWSLEE